MAGLFLIFGIGCLLYFCVIVLSAGLQVSFGAIWLLLGAFFLGTAYVLKTPAAYNLFLRIPKGLRFGAGILLLAGVLAFVGLESCIISGMLKKSDKKPDAVIVLGAQVRGTNVSRALAQRLRAAVGYLEENPDAYVIVSGGQGPGEDITEAQAMQEYLIALGIDPERIIQENQSQNTAQNLRYSFALLKDPNDTVGVVSNGFHVFRAVHIAKAEGLETMGIPAKTDWWMLPHYMMREAFALAKDLLLGNAMW